MSERAWLVPVAGGPAVEIAAELCLVGRQPDCDLHLDDKTVSKIHCALARFGRTLMLRDLGSTNGCRVNGQKSQRGTLRANDLLTVAGFDFRLHFGEAPAARPQFALDRTECLPINDPALSDSGRHHER